jgi:type IV secretory pathway VirB4 component
VAFLRNLTRHMMGEGRAEDTDLLDNLLTEAILRTYKRAAIRQSDPIPTFSDLRDELAQWRDEQKNQRVMDEAHLAAIKLRSWTGEKGPYSRLFDRSTTISLENSWLFFNIEKLADDLRLQGAMSLVIARAMSLRASGKTGSPAIVVMDEFSFILDSQVLAPEAVQLFRTARKRGVIVCGISQTIEDYVGTTDKPRLQGPGIVKNASTKIIGQQPGDTTALREHLRLSETAINTIKQFSTPRKGRYADALIVIGEKAETTHTIRMAPTAIEYWIMTTYPRERVYRSWWLRQRKDVSKIQAYLELARKFPEGLAEVDPLPEEVSGEVTRGMDL